MPKFNHILICVFAALFFACSLNEKDIFPASSADRLNQALEVDNNALIAAKNGWVMEYFATPNSAGYTFLVKFNASGQAIFTAKNEFTTNAEIESDSCLYQLIGDNGPVLTFDTYNKILHRFSTPENPDGIGLAGDYEFVVMKVADDLITLRGKKRNSVILLKKLAPGVSWNQYINNLDALNTFIFSKKSPTLTLKVDTKTISFSNGYKHIFNIVTNAPEADKIDKKIPFVVTSNGIRLYSELEFGGYKFQNFELNADKSVLVSVEHPQFKLVGAEDLALYFVSNVVTWDFVPNELSADVLQMYNQLVNSCQTNYNAQDIKLSIKYSTFNRSFMLALSFVSNAVPVEGNMYMSLNTSGLNGIVIGSKNDGDGKIYYNEVAGYKEMISYLNSTFAVSTASALNPQKIKFSKKTISSSFFNLIQK